MKSIIDFSPVGLMALDTHSLAGSFVTLTVTCTHFPVLGGMWGIQVYKQNKLHTRFDKGFLALSFVLKLLHNPAVSQVPELSTSQERWGCECRPIESYLIISSLVGNCFIPELSSQSSALEK